MATQTIEVIKQKIIAFLTAAGEIVFLGDPVDAGDYEEAVVQMDTLSSSGTINPGDITWGCDTSISSADYAKYDACFTELNLSSTAGASAAARISTSSTTPLRRWLRLYARHTVTTAGQVVTVHATVFLKKRVP